jgi:hypothetical protein
MRYSRTRVEENTFRRDLMAEALLCRLRGTEPAGDARMYAGLPLRGFETLCNASSGMSFDVTLAGGKSDFPWLLGDVLSKRLLDFYETAKPTARLLTKRVSLKDFREHSILLVGSYPQLEKVAEHGEFKYGFLEEGGEPLTLASYGRILPLSRQAIWADDVGALDDVARLAVQAALTLEDSLLFASLLSGTANNGPTLRDGVQLFHANHANLASGAALDATSLGAAMALLRKQTSIGGELVNLGPRFLVVGPDLEVTARQLVVDITPPGETPIGVVVDAHIEDASFYIWADPEQRPGYVRGYLDATAAPYAVAREGFVLDGAEFKVRHDVAVGPADYRPIVRTPPAP